MLPSAIRSSITCPAREPSQSLSSYNRIGTTGSAVTSVNLPVSKDKSVLGLHPRSNAFSFSLVFPTATFLFSSSPLVYCTRKQHHPYFEKFIEFRPHETIIIFSFILLHACANRTGTIRIQGLALQVRTTSTALVERNTRAEHQYYSVRVLHNKKQTTKNKALSIYFIGRHRTVTFLASWFGWSRISFDNLLTSSFLDKS